MDRREPAPERIVRRAQVLDRAALNTRDIVIAAGRIVALTEPGAGAEAVDARGLLLLLRFM